MSRNVLKDVRYHHSLYTYPDVKPKSMEDLVKAVGGAIGSLFIIWFFGFVFFPEFGKAVGQDVLLYQISLVMLGGAVLLGAILTIVRR
jgi:hypothetical protein